MDWPSPLAKASRISGRPAWFSMVRGSDCESASTWPSEAITVTRTLLAAIFAAQPRRATKSSGWDGESDARNGGELLETGTLVVAPQSTLGIEIDGEQDRDQQGEKGKTEFPEKIKPHGFQKDSPRPGRVSNAWGFQDRTRFFHAGAGRRRPRCAASRSDPFPRPHRAIDLE